MTKLSVPLLSLLSIALAWSSVTAGSGCSWTGRMPGPGGSAPCPSPTNSQECPRTPSYEEIDAQGKLWTCPSYTKSNGGQYFGNCTKGQGPNPLCSFDATSPKFGCCCPLDGCWTPPYFNWIIATCKASGCGAYKNTPSTQKYKDAGSEVIVNYAASYQWNSVQRLWQLVPESSFNTDGSQPPYDTLRPNGGLKTPWMQPQPGGAADWSWGYYPAGVKGVGPPGMMFVISTEKSFNLAWYMLNQVTLDKGPTTGYPNNKCPYGNNNCWATANSGEIDFLESAWTVNAGAADNYRRLYSTQWNQVGRSFIGDQGSTCNADGGWFNDQEASNNYFLGTGYNQSVPYIFVAVVDHIGTFIYRIPASMVESVWPGLSRTTAACTVSARPTRRPDNSGPPCDDTHPYCALFLPNCQASDWGGASAGHQGGANQGCKVNGQQGWCKNWWNLLDNTEQWLWPENGHPSVVQYQTPAAPVANPWNYEMEAWKVDWKGQPKYNAGCCVKNTGHCPKV